MTLRPIDARSGETRAAGLDGEATKAGCPKGRPNNPKEIRTMPDPLVEQTALVEAIITAYNTARPSHQSAADHILSKCFVTTAFMRFMAAMNGGTLPSVTEGREEIARIVEKIGDFAHLGHNWDSYGGKRIEPETIGLAQAFAHWLPTPDHVTPLPHGGVGFRWSSADIDIDMKPDGEIEGVIPSDPATLAKADRILASLPSANMVETAYPVEERAFHVVRRGDGEDLSFVAQDRACLTSIPAADRDDAYNLSSSLNRVVRFHVERAVASTTPTDPSIKRIREAAQAVIDRMSSTYKARNGREMGIEADDGEKCWIVHSDEIEALRAALSNSISSGEGV